ncbi:ABC transporter ATP-binding protein [Microbacterium rhizophilus]|uniref:ABC transporter ATP-binding protein n=1 Tax=Microbacterium rhizophilus TaxID=3138934 RepID=UPI0031EB6333
MGMITMHVEGVSAAYAGRAAVRDVTLPPLRSGETVAVIGPDGAGKSTFLRRLAGFQRGAGDVDVRDDDKSVPHGNRILYLPQDPPPRSGVTVFDVLEVAARLRRGTAPWIDETGIALVLAELEIEIDHLAGRRLSELSGGQRQLVALGQAIVRRPDVLLLDEPTSSLDLRNQLDVLHTMVRTAREQPAIVVAVVHDLGLAARFADRVVTLRDGRVHSTGTPTEVITAEMLEEVYRVEGSVHISEDGALSVAVARSLPRSTEDLRG